MIDHKFVNDKGLHFVHINIRSLLAKGKLDTLRAQLTNSNIHVLSLSETWLNNKIPSTMVKINGFTVSRLDRQNCVKMRGGGLALYIDETIPYNDNKFQRLNISNKYAELQCVSLNLEKLREIVIVNIYRPPQGSLKTFIDLLSKTTLEILNSCKSNVELYLMGDFNIDFLDKKDKNVKELIQTMKSAGNNFLIKDQTRIGGKASCLDQIFTNSNYISNSGILDVNLSDHLAVYCSRKKMKSASLKINFEGRSYRNYIKEDFQDNLIN